MQKFYPPRDIASQLRGLFQRESDADSASRPGDQRGMSVGEKMLLWSTKPDEGDYPTTPDDAFQGVDDLDDSPDHPEVSTYGRAILESKEYGWFIQQLQRESSFHWGPGPRIMVDELRHTIMAGMPTRVSRKQDPCVHKAEFRFAWPRLRRQLLREPKTVTDSWSLDPSWDGWGWDFVTGTVVLVGSSDGRILATTVKEYIDKTWGGETELLKKFRDALEGELATPNHHGKRSFAAAHPPPPYSVIATRSNV